MSRYERQQRRTERARRRAVGSLAAALLLLAVIVLMIAARIADRKEIVSGETIRANIDALEIEPALPAEAPAEETMHLEPSEDTILLAKIMQEEDGVDWPDAMIMCIGEVVLNRVASPEYPDTVRDVLHQVDGGFIQYAPVQAAAWESIEPEQEYIDLAERLLNGERVMNDPRIVYQALFEQGSETILAYHDSALGTTTYFCREAG